jgi:hypothetical protein
MESGQLFRFGKLTELVIPALMRTPSASKFVAWVELIRTRIV